MHRCHGLALIALLTSGCAYAQLKHSAVNQASVLTEFQYQQVLDNLAMIHDNPSAIPWHVNLNTGTAQVTDFGSTSLLLAFGRMPGHLATYSPSVSAQRTIVETWGSVPVTNENNLKLLRMAYHNAYGWGETLAREDFKDLKDDLQHDLNDQTHVSPEEAKFQPDFDENQLSRDDAPSVTMHKPFSERNVQAEDTFGPIEYLLADSVAVTSNDTCLECDLKEKPEDFSIYIEGSRVDTPTSVDRRRFVFNQSGFYAKPTNHITLIENQKIYFYNNDNVAHTVWLPQASIACDAEAPDDGDAPRTNPSMIEPGKRWGPWVLPVSTGDGHPYYSENNENGVDNIVEITKIKVVDKEECDEDSEPDKAVVRRIVYDGITLDNHVLEEYSDYPIAVADDSPGMRVRPAPEVRYRISRRPTDIDAGNAVAWVNKTGEKAVRIKVYNIKKKKWMVVQNYLSWKPEFYLSTDYLFPLSNLAYKFAYRIEELTPDKLSDDPRKAFTVDTVTDGIVFVDASRKPSFLVKETCRQLNDINGELKKIPNGWFHVGGKHDVPHDVCFKGHYGKTWVWVCPEGREQLSQFTLSVLKLAGTVKEKQIVASPGVQYSPGFALGGPR